MDANYLFSNTFNYYTYSLTRTISGELLELLSDESDEPEEPEESDDSDVVVGL
jgi:hypothetical protein